MKYRSVVWFKKDLRVSDHLPLFKASETGRCLGLFVLEDKYLAHPTTSDIHLQFLKDSLTELQIKLADHGIPLLILKGETPAVLADLKRLTGFERLYSHQETGLMWTYKRDIEVGRWCKENSVVWDESPQFAVIRGLGNRDRWNSLRNSVNREIVSSPVQQTPSPPTFIKVPGTISCDEISHSYSESIQVGGSREAHQLLQSFLSNRGKNYRAEMSSPLTAFDSCSRLSPHITWGTISLTEITKETRQAKSELYPLPDEDRKQWSGSLKSFESRLWWHCHFIQKLESEPEIEFQNMNRGFDGMRESDFDQARFEAWCKGETGVPMIDACMKALIKHGWINFRMRAMLISFASYQLWLHWKKTSEHLARHFVDYEPGIHYSQIQMQSGVTGINTIRIYSPQKQGADKDPNGDFVKRFLPQLEGFSAKEIHKPNEVPPMMQTMLGCRIGSDYPEPIVDSKASYNEAKKKIFSWRSRPEVKEMAKDVYRRHGSRKNQFFPSQHRRSFGNWDSKKDKCEIGLEMERE